MWNSLQRGIQCLLKQITCWEETSQFSISFLADHEWNMKKTMKESENAICSDYIVGLGVELEMLSSSSFSLVIHWIEKP